MARRYKVEKRAESAAATRRRIVEATFALHQEQAISDTSMKQIAARAGVGIGTVYNHFPTYPDAIRACGQHTFALAPPPTDAIFAGLTSRAARVQRLAASLFAFYRACPGVAQARHDQTKFAVLDEALQWLDGHIAELIRSAIGTAPKRVVAVVTALLDYDSHKQLVRQGLSTDRAAVAAADLVLHVLAANEAPAISPGRNEKDKD